jgi:hypothetical protein
VWDKGQEHRIDKPNTALLVFADIKPHPGTKKKKTISRVLSYYNFDYS